MRDAEGNAPDTGPITLAQAIHKLHAGELTSVALVERCLERIALLDPALQACVTVMADAAREQAAAADEALATRRDRRPLLGVPLGIKDLIETRGVRTTAGSRVLDDWIPDADATVVKKLAAAGAIPICKTNTHEFAFGTLTPPTRNPWDLARSPGGSSGGSAAAVAAGECVAAIGTDTGGSIRIPASWCGVTGLKPTFGLIGRAGIIPLSWSLDHVGPIARTVEDCALLLDALVGHDSDDPDSLDAPLPDYEHSLMVGRSPEDALRGTRIGVPTNYFFDQVDREVETAVRGAIDLFAQLGAEPVEVQVPRALDHAFTAIYRAIQKPEAFTYHSDQGWLADRVALYTPTLLANILSGADYSAADYIHAQRARRRFTEEMRALLDGFGLDALATPATPIPACTPEEYERGLTTNGRELIGGSLRCTFPINLTGQPAISVPCGFTTTGLPIGLQLLARHFGETTLFRIGHAYQRATDWHLRTPDLDDISQALGGTP